MLLFRLLSDKFINGNNIIRLEIGYYNKRLRCHDENETILCNFFIYLFLVKKKEGKKEKNISTQNKKNCNHK
jgi:hypothetical protein